MRDLPESEFRAEIRAFLRDSLPPDMRARGLSGYGPDGGDSLAWQRILASRGWSVPHWPVEYGGTDWSHSQRYLFEEECFIADAPMLNVQGIGLIGPVIYTFGTDEQKKRFGF